MIFLEILLLFILFPNVILLVLLKNDICKIIGRNFSLLISYGLAPLISGLIFYYLIWLFPKRIDSFYICLVFLFWSLLLLYSREKIKEASVIYENISTAVIDGFSIKKYGAYFVVFLFTIIFSIQALAYPISENDSAWYFAQSEALHQSRDAHWYESGVIILNGVNGYFYNKMIRPGIPSFMAFSFLFGQKESNYFIFNFFFVFYYYLIAGILMLVVSRLANALGKDRALSKFVAFLFLVFYWNMTRFYIFNNKEVVIYFLALAGICLIYALILMEQRNRKIELLLGVILGLNSFVNFHGILIGIFLLGILFLFSQLSFWQRIWQVAFIFSVNLFFSAFEFVQSFGFIFLDTFNNFLEFCKKSVSIINTKTDAVIDTATNTAVETLNSSTGGAVIDSVSQNTLSGNQKMELMHAQMYQMSNFKDVYLKGKLQMITGVGSYGFYFLFFLLILVSRFKEITVSIFGRTILLFMAIYYLVVIDPLNLNKNDLAIILWGSPKYSMLMVLFSIIIVSVYFDHIIHAIFRYVYKNKLLISAVLFFSAIALYIFKSSVIGFGLKILLGFVQISRDISFYAGKVELFYYVILSLVFFLGIALAVFYLMKTAENIAYRFFFALCLLFMIAPFFIVNVGKVPLNETFSFLEDSRETKLQNIIYFGDLFKVYYYAKNNLPKGTLVQTDFIETYTYNDYFKLRRVGGSDVNYKIGEDCVDNQNLYSAGVFSLCQIKNPS